MCCEYFLAVYIIVIFSMVSFEEQKLLMLIKSNVHINIVHAWLKCPLFYPKELFVSPTAAAQLLQLCLSLCDPMDCSPPGPSVHGILQAKILELVAMSFSR